MKSTELVAKAIDIAAHYKTVYMWGVFGAPVTTGLIEKKAAQYPDWYTPARVAAFRALVGKGYFAFDCVNTIKAILWGWTGDPTATYGGAKYVAGGIPDTNADGFIQRCKNVTTNFSQAKPGDAVWMAGHIGIYIGGGKAVECTPAWENSVQITAVGNLGKVAGLHTRTWTKIGTNPYIEYEEDDDMADIMNKLKVQTGLTEAEIIAALVVLVTQANTVEDGWEKAAAAGLKTGGLVGSDHKGNEPVEFGELGSVLNKLEAKIDNKYRRKTD